MQLPDFPGTARDDAASFTIDEKIYVGTGMEVGWGLTNDWFCYDTNMENWTVIASLPASPRQYAVGFTIAGNGYLFGGLDANGALNELWCYDPDLDNWVEKAPLPGEGRYACVAADDGWTGQIATGMLSNGIPTNEHWHYNASVDAWFASAPVPGPARHRAASFTNSSFVVIGGADENGNALADVWKYDVLFPTGEWTEGPPLPAPRYGAKGVSAWDLVIGGASDPNTIHADVWQLLSSSTAWVGLPAFEGGPRRGAVTGSKPCLIVMGPGAYFGTGLNNDLQRRMDWWLLQPPVGIEERMLSPVQCVPNPSTNNFSIQFPSAMGVTGLLIMDLSGRMILSTPLFTPTVDASAWPSGSYIVQVTSAAGNRYRARWVKL